MVESGDGWWTARVPYGVAEWGFQTGSDSYTFDTSGGTFHARTSREVVHSYASGGPSATPPDIGGANGGVIGPNGEGVDVFVPKNEWEETHIFSWGDIDNDFKALLRRMTARTNDAPWRDCAEGEAIFLGARGGRLPDNTGAITFRFASGTNIVAADNYYIGDIGPIEAGAWDYVDVHFEGQDLGDGENKALMKTPRFVYVHRMYFKGDFTDLGIGS
jgi:hypothetical protein